MRLDHRLRSKNLSRQTAEDGWAYSHAGIWRGRGASVQRACSSVAAMAPSERRGRSSQSGAQNPHTTVVLCRTYYNSSPSVQGHWHWHSYAAGQEVESHKSSCFAHLALSSDSTQNFRQIAGLLCTVVIQTAERPVHRVMVHITFAHYSRLPNKRTTLRVIDKIGPNRLNGRETSSLRIACIGVGGADACRVRPSTHRR